MSKNVSFVESLWANNNEGSKFQFSELSENKYPLENR